jgi:PDZ domain-containing protein
VTIDQKVKQYPTSDHLFFTTVALTGGPDQSRVTLFQAIRGWFDSSTAVVPKNLLFPEGASSAQVDCENTKQQQSSQNNAKVAALQELHYTVPVERHVYVDAFSPNSPAQAAGIGICDDIVSVDGTPVTSEQQLLTLIRQHAVGDTVRIGYVHSDPVNGDKREVAQVRLAASTSGTPRPVIGVAPQHIDISKPPFTVDIHAGDVGGPSAGLMYALAIIDKLTPGDLTGGVVVAGTGEITVKGAVGPIGGIQQKLLTARAHDATVFLVPKDNCSEAVHAKPKGMRLAMVNSLTDALNVMAALRHEPSGVIHDCTP